MGWSSALRKQPAAPQQPVFAPPVIDAERVDWAKLVSLDFETYYDDDYTLRKLTTSEYIRDERFEALMLGLKVGTGALEVVPGPEIAKRLKAIDWSTHSILAHHCVPGDTEVLTPKGWKRIAAARDDETIMQWDSTTGALTWCTPLAKIKQRATKLLRWNTEFHRAAYTPQHRMYYQTPDQKDWRAAPATEVAEFSQSNTYIPVAGVYKSATQIHLTADEARLMEAVRADASWAVTEGVYYGARFNLRKQRKIERLHALCAALGISVDKVNNRYILRRSYILDRIYELLSPSKQYGSWVLNLSVEARRAVLDELMYWDGTDRGMKTGFSWCTADVATANAVELMAHLSGWSISGAWVENSRGLSAHLPNAVLYRATVRRRARIKLIKKPTEVKHRGDVYCYTVPTGAFMIRAGGRVCITGNCHFDGLILSHHFGVKPKRVYCSLSMARGLHANDIGAGLDEVSQFYGGRGKLASGTEGFKGLRYRELAKQVLKYKRAAKYCGNDVLEMLRVFKAMLPRMPCVEMDLIDVVVRMFTEPVLVLDEKRARAEYDREVAAKKALLLSFAEDAADIKLDKQARDKLEGRPDEDWAIARVKKLVGSAAYADLLKREGVEPPVKISPAYFKHRDETRKWTYAFAKTDLNFTALQEHPNERVRGLVDARLSVKSSGIETRAGRLLKLGANGAAMPVYYKYAAAHTLRLGGGDKTNFQNFKRGGELRKSIRAPKGHVLVVADSAQIEPRTNAWLWGQDDLLADFVAMDTKTGPDPYCKFAEVLYGYSVTKDDNPDERFIGKVATIMLGYQAGAQKFQNTLALGTMGPPVFLEFDLCQAAVNTYRRKNYRIKDGWKKCEQIIADMAAGRTGTYKCISWEKETIWLPDGMSLRYPGLRKKRNEDSDWDEWVYTRKGEEAKLYGGLLCLAGDTEVLTDGGWKQIVDVSINDRLWDGVQWVQHAGLAHQGVKPTLDFGGVRMTPDHEVLVDEKWIEAQHAVHAEATSSFARHYRTPARTARSVAGFAHVRQTGLPEPVYDLINAGPNRRFTVRGNDGRPFLVHNCENLVQALAKIIVMGQLLIIAKRYKVPMTTHDEVVACVKTREARAAEKFMLATMRTPPAWCADLPLNAEAGYAAEYSK